MTLYSPATNYSDNDSCNSLVSYSYSSTASAPSNAPPTPEPETDDLKVLQTKPLKPAVKKQYQCTQCLKNFSRPSALQTHSYTHTAEKPFQCLSPNCGRRFSVVSNLRRHFKVHQKPSVGSKLSSEDRLRCVQQLMKRSSALLSNKQAETMTDHHVAIQPSMMLDQQPQKQPQQCHRYQHYFILPSINKSTTNNGTGQTHFTAISPSSTAYYQDQQSSIVGDLSDGLFLNSSMASLPLYLSSGQFDTSVHDNSREREYLTPSQVLSGAEDFFTSHNQQYEGSRSNINDMMNRVYA